MGRELTFADPRIIRLVKENFVAVAADDWFQRRRKDAEGDFFRKVANQGPRKGQGGSTRQGIYTLTADGKLLQYRNHQDADIMHGFLKTSLAAWNRLPAVTRAKGSVEVAPLKAIDPRFAPTLPKGAVIVNVHARILDRQDDFYCHGTCRFPGGQRASHDHLWIRAEELRALMPANPRQGQEIAIPAKLIYRIARYHLVDNTRGEPPMWTRRDVRKADMKLMIESIDKREVRLKLMGSFLLATDADVKLAKRGYDVALLGDLRYDPERKKLTRFDIVALGGHWGQGTYTGGARLGRMPFGVAFELADPNRPADRVPPQFIREGGDYYNAER
ncbi:MAG: hypothetical protein HYX68_26780 [Planctomycetes bacterium]|nr:hypothetical protein [Planctomycetota bacterium]